MTADDPYITSSDQTNCVTGKLYCVKRTDLCSKPYIVQFTLCHTVSDQFVHLSIGERPYKDPRWNAYGEPMGI